MIVKFSDDHQFNGREFLTGKLDQMKQLVVDTLQSENNWIGVRSKLDAGVRKSIGRDCTIATYEKGQNGVITTTTKTLMLEVKGGMRIAITPHP